MYIPAEVAKPFRATNEQIDLVEAIVARDDCLEQARSIRDLGYPRSTGMIASLLGAEGGHSIERACASFGTSLGVASGT